MQGQQIGSYKIERTLGQGGFGVVYVGVDVRLGRRAAIKQLLPELSSNREIVERFFNEAKAAANINHMGIVEIYDVGWHTDGSAYFAMKLLDGDSLAKRIRSVGRMPVAIAATITRQVAAALTAAHKTGIVHRDLKPDNIILVADEETSIGERAIVLDFGIAKLFGDAPLSQKTRTGMLMGTPLYMSPEQCRGAGEVDHRTDVYALGCILFEMLTGRPPFEGEGAGEILGKHQFVDAPEVRSLRDDVPPDLAAIVSKALSKKPEARQQLMVDLAAALSPFTAGSVSAQHVAQTPAPKAPEPSVEMVRPITPPPAEPPSTFRASAGEVATPVVPPATKRSSVPWIAAAVAAIVTVVVILIVTSSSSTTGPQVAQTPSPVDAAVTTAEMPPDGPAPADAPPAPAVEQTKTRPGVDVDSKQILARAPVTDTAYVKHVLFAWDELASTYKDRLDPRAKKRTNAEAAKLAREMLAKVDAAGGDALDALIKEHSEDPGSLTGVPYKITAKSPFVPEFKQLGLRLREAEAGLVQTRFGYHVMKRVTAPPLDPVESAAILARPKRTDYAEVQHVLVAWKDLPTATDGRAKNRDKAAAAALAKELLAKARTEDMTKLMKTYSEDPGSKDTGGTYTITEDESLVEGFITLGLRLDLGEVGVVKTEHGFHVVKRVSPDPIQSLAILARPVAAEKAKIKYILLGYNELYIGGDERGKNRTRAELEKLIQDTVGRLQRGTKFEDVMKELSADKQTGTGTSIGAATVGLPSMLKMIGTRLKLDELGVAKTRYGVFIIKRVE